MFDITRVNTHPPTASRRLGRHLILVWLLISSGTVGAAIPANGDTCRPAELYAAHGHDDTGDPDDTGNSDDRLFELQAGLTLILNGATVTGSTLLDGVFWDGELHQVSYEHARQFHLCVADQPTLHNAAEALRHQFDQQAVLTFDYLPENAADAITVTAPDIDIARFRAAFVADAAAQRRLKGGSVSVERTLILVADKSDLDIARRLVGAAGGDWATATVASGNREFVT